MTKIGKLKRNFKMDLHGTPNEQVPATTALKYAAFIGKNKSYQKSIRCWFVY